MVKISTLALSALCSISAFAQGAYAPGAGQTGSDAIYKDSSLFKSWASGIEITRGPINISDPNATFNASSYASFGTPSNALGKAGSSNFEVVSLGDGGTATLTFDRQVSNGPGPDFAVFENSFSDKYLELAFVEVSSDGKKFVRFPAVSLTPANMQIKEAASLDATNLFNLAGKYRLGYGTPFDLNDIKDSTGIDLNNIRFIRVRDVVGSIDPKYASYDSKGNIINDPWPSAFHSCGFDLDAVGIINTGKQYTISTFDELSLNKDSYWNGSDQSGGFSSGEAFFKNNYTKTDNGGYWSGFAYSNMRNDSVPGYDNQYSAISAGGINAPDSGGTNYVVAYSSGWEDNFISFKGEKAYIVNGFYITNSTYAYLSIKNGDNMGGKKFGGNTGNDPDFFKASFWGEREDSSFTDTVDFYLSDFRFSDNSKDYLVNSWNWVDLQKLGKIRKVHFSMSSSDIGDWGMNTPSYFCLDNLSIQEESAQVKINNVYSDSKVYPNPFTTDINVIGEINSSLSIYDLSGHVIMQRHMNSNNENIGLENLSKGVYMIRIQGTTGTRVEKIIKK